MQALMKAQIQVRMQVRVPGMEFFHLLVQAFGSGLGKTVAQELRHHLLVFIVLVILHDLLVYRSAKYA